MDQDEILLESRSNGEDGREYVREEGTLRMSPTTRTSSTVDVLFGKAELTPGCFILCSSSSCRFKINANAVSKGSCGKYKGCEIMRSSLEFI